MYSKGMEWGKVKESPAKKVKLLKGETKRLWFLMPDEIQKLFSNCTDQTDLGVDDYWSEVGIPFIPHLQI